jgi:uncharacterized protein (TIGR03382 family)
MTKTNRWLLVGASALGLALGHAALEAPAARACGGFFCQTVPIDQSGEYILFSITDQGVRAYIQIQYQGKAEDFAWVVPLTSAPTKVGVGVQQVFTTLMNQTVPTFNIDWKIPMGGFCGGREESANAAPRSASGGAAKDGVNVLAQGEVGPYSYVVVSAEEAGKLKTWLDENGFVQPPSAAAPLAHYVQQKFVFLAIKLKRGAETGEIQPLVVDMPNPEACIPLVLTRIAALPDMPIYALVLGKHRAVPRNWFQVEVNQKKIDWFNRGSNYRQLVTAAIDEAAGHGFVTEYAGPTTRFKDQLWTAGRYDTTKLATLADPVAFVEELRRLFPSNQRGAWPPDPILLSILQRRIPMPASLVAQGLPPAAFYNSLGAYREHLAGLDFDPVAAAKEVEERIVKPLEEAQRMVDGQPYLTRLFTTISPAEMTRDPLFDFNPDLPQVDNVHTAVGTGACNRDGRLSNVSLALPNGETLKVPGLVSPFGGSVDMGFTDPLPAAARVELVGPSGAPVEVARQKIKLIDEALDTVDPRLARELARPDEPAPKSGGCASGGALGPAPGALSLVGLAALARLLRRRRSGGGRR